MGSWRSKFVFTLVVYFAGFATAIYALAPGQKVVKQAGMVTGRSNFAASILKSDEFATKFNIRMQECIGAGKKAAVALGEVIREKTQAAMEQSEG